MVTSPQAVVAYTMGSESDSEKGAVLILIPAKFGITGRPERTGEQLFHDAGSVMHDFGFEPGAGSRAFRGYCRIFVPDSVARAVFAHLRGAGFQAMMDR